MSSYMAARSLPLPFAFHLSSAFVFFFCFLFLFYLFIDFFGTFFNGFASNHSAIFGSRYLKQFVAVTTVTAKKSRSFNLKKKKKELKKNGEIFWRLAFAKRMKIEFQFQLIDSILLNSIQQNGCFVFSWSPHKIY